VVYNALKGVAEKIFPILKTLVTGGNGTVDPAAAATAAEAAANV